MATGDAAGAKGLRVVPETKDLKLGYDDINKRGDELAQEIDDRTAGDASKLDASKIRVTNTPMTVGTAAVGDLRFW